MDSTISAAGLARELNTSVPRVVRAIERLGLSARQENGRMRLTSADTARLRRELGVSPPPIPGLTRVEVRVLGALAQAPLGMTSARTAAERAGVSPTTASRAIDSLRKKGLVSVERQTLPAGRARAFDLIRLDYGAPRWQRLAGRIAGTRPRGHRPQASGPRRVPPRLKHLFWNTAPSQLDVERSGSYIARRLLSAGDPEGLAWGAANLSEADWRHAARTRGISPRRRALALNYAAARSRDDAAR